MTTTERHVLPPIECTPWCIYGDGHADALFAQDQTCTGEWHRTPLSPEGDERISVLAWRGAVGVKPSVCINVYTEDSDDDLHLTLAQARLFAESLLAVVETIEAVR